MINKKCYRLQNIHFQNGLFNKCTDCAYVLVMESSKNKYMEQINKFKPHSNIIIQYNKGYKKCKKVLLEQKPSFDLSDALFQVFNHANKNKYKNILVFEEDFFFDNSKISKQDVTNINNFVKNRPYIDTYHLGPLLTASTPYIMNLKHRKIFFQSSAHSVIYSKRYRNYYIKQYLGKSIVDGIDGSIFNNIYFNKYCYYKPVCFQLINETENRKQGWNKIMKLFVSLIEFLDLHKSNRNYTRLYNLINVLVFIIIILLIILGANSIKKFL